MNSFFSGFPIDTYSKMRLVTRHDRVKWRLAQKLKGKMESICRMGRVDVLTDVEAIEVKSTKRWKEAVGQSLCYAHCTNRIARVHLYGDRRLCQAKEDTISQLGVRLSYDFDEIKGK